MDPEITWEWLKGALIAGMPGQAATHATELAIWIEGGGYLPEELKTWIAAR